MANIPTLRLLKPEDYDTKDQALVTKLAFSLNIFMQQIVSALSNSLDFNNLNMQVNTFTVTVNATGQPITPLRFQNNLSTKLYGIVCINALNQSGDSTYPVAQPFISWTQSGNTVTVNNITGLGIPTGQTQSDAYSLTVLLIGQDIPNNS
jgi:hypothetical protein